MTDEIERLRAELAAERERVDNLAAIEKGWRHIVHEDRKRAIAAEEQRDAALAALRQARVALSWMLLEGVDEVIPETCPNEYRTCTEALAQIDAVLKGGGDG